LAKESGIGPLTASCWGKQGKIRLNSRAKEKVPNLRKLSPNTTPSAEKNKMKRTISHSFGEKEDAPMLNSRKGEEGGKRGGI